MAKRIYGRTSPEGLKAHLATLDHDELVQQCKDEGISPDGSTSNLRSALYIQMVYIKGLWDDNQSKRRKTSHGEKKGKHNGQQGCSFATMFGEEYTCPITLALPFDPVRAEDNRVYEREAIQEHIKRNARNLKSPMTNEPMGSRLMPDTGVKKLIEAAVTRYKIVGELAETWLAKRKFEECKRKAQAGDGKMAVFVARSYQFSENGQTTNIEEAAKYWEIAADADELEGLTMHGLRLALSSDSTEQSSGAQDLAVAANRGSVDASMQLGFIYACGEGVPRSEIRAQRLLSYALDPQNERGRLLHHSDDVIRSMHELLNLLEARLRRRSSPNFQHGVNRAATRSVGGSEENAAASLRSVLRSTYMHGL